MGNVTFLSCAFCQGLGKMDVLVGARRATRNLSDLE